MKNLIKLTLWLLLAVILAACGGGGGSGSGTPASKVNIVSSGVAQKGPLLKNSTVVAQELDAALSPTGKQYTYQIEDDLGRFTPTSQFTSSYIGLNANGYYFDEVRNAVSSGQLSLQGVSDLNSDTTLNVNLLSTLAYQRIKTLVASNGMTVAAARNQAESEVLNAFFIYNGNAYGNFASLDISKHKDGDNILAALSSLFVYGNDAGNLSSLIAAFQSDIADNGVIDTASTKNALAASAKAINPATIAANLTTKYSGVTTAFTSTDISDWIDQDGDNLIGKYKFKVMNASKASSYTIPTAAVTYLAGKSISISAGQLSINNSPITGAVTIQDGDTVLVSPDSTFESGTFTVYLLNGTTRLAKVSFLHTLVSVEITPTTPYTGVGLKEQLTLKGTYLDGSISAISTGVTWSSDDTNTATVDSTGLVSGVALGSANITAIFGTVTKSSLFAVTASPWSNIPSLATQRARHTSTLLNNGKVLVVGGSNNNGATILASSELYDPESQTWSSAGNITTARWSHTATLLDNGKVLITGGFKDAGTTPVKSAELYDPSTNTWSVVASMSATRVYHTATLVSGKVLVVGGYTDASGGTTLDSAELYDPVSNTWSSTPNLLTTLKYHTATLIAVDKVLVAGGQGIAGPLGAAQVYDSGANSWTTTGAMTDGRYSHTATLVNGKVLVTGGYGIVSVNSVPIASAELYDPGANTWTTVASLSVERCLQSANLVNGKVLVVGGFDSTSNPLFSAELYDPNSNTWSSAGTLTTSRALHTATNLANNKVIVIGGKLALGSVELSWSW